VGPRTDLELAKNLAPTGIFFYNASFVRILYCVVLVLDLGPHAVDFSSRKNPTASVGSEPANLKIRSPDRPAVAQSLYRLSYPAHKY
jgi:hypothetical protein